MKGLIICIDNNSFLEPLTYTTPKYMLPAANAPLCEHIIRSLSEANIRDIAVVISDDFKNFINNFGNDLKFNCNIKYYSVNKSISTMYALLYAKNFINDDLVIIFGDNYFDFPLLKYINVFNKSNYDIMVLLKETENVWNHDIAEIEGNKILNIANKPKITQSKYALSNIYFFSRSLLRSLSKGKSLKYINQDIPPFINHTIHRGGNVGFKFIDTTWMKINRTKDLLECNKNILSKMNQNSTISFDARIIKSEIKDNVSIGKRSIVKNSIISNSIIMDDCIIDSAVLNNCIVGNYSSIIGKNQIINGVFGDKSNILIMENESEE